MELLGRGMRSRSKFESSGKGCLEKPPQTPVGWGELSQGRRRRGEHFRTPLQSRDPFAPDRPHRHPASRHPCIFTGFRHVAEPARQSAPEPAVETRPEGGFEAGFGPGRGRVFGAAQVRTQLPWRKPAPRATRRRCLSRRRRHHRRRCRRPGPWPEPCHRRSACASTYRP